MRSNELSGLTAAAIQVGCSINVRVQRVDPSLSQMLLEQPIQAIGMQMKNEKKTVTISSQKNTTFTKLAKPFRIYTAEVIGAWPYGGTSSATTAELLLPGGSVGNCGVSKTHENSNLTITGFSPF